MKKYLTDLAERAAASAAGAVLAAWGSDAVNLFNVNWGIARGAAVVSVLKGIVAKFVGNSDSASLSSKV